MQWEPYRIEEVNETQSISQLVPLLKPNLCNTKNKQVLDLKKNLLPQYQWRCYWRNASHPCTKQVDWLVECFYLTLFLHTNLRGCFRVKGQKKNSDRGETVPETVVCSCSNIVTLAYCVYYRWKSARRLCRIRQNRQSLIKEVTQCWYKIRLLKNGKLT